MGPPSLRSTKGPQQDVGSRSQIRSCSGSHQYHRPNCLFPYGSRLRLHCRRSCGPHKGHSVWSITPKVAHGPLTGSLDQIHYPVDHGVPQTILTELSEMGSKLRILLLPWFLFEPILSIEINPIEVIFAHKKLATSMSRDFYHTLTSFRPEYNDNTTNRICSLVISLSITLLLQT